MVVPVPKQRGTGVLPVVHGLKMLPGGRDLVPEHLQHYLDRPVLPSEWYPEQDFNTLIQALANLIPPRAVGGDVWAYFGRTAAQRDLAGQQDALAPSVRLEAVGAYRKLAQGVSGGVAGLALRTMKLWSLYHDTGQLVCFRSRSDPGVLVVRLVDFAFPVAGLLDLQMAYIAEFARLAGIRVAGRVRRATTDGDPHCEWEFRLEPTPENVASLAQLPVDAG